MISIHASRGGSDQSGARHCPCRQIFQSTLPVGEATAGATVIAYIVGISIHASRGGSDPDKYVMRMGGWSFQSTLPVGEATRESAEFDSAKNYFNPRFPWGKRPQLGI